MLYRDLRQAARHVALGGSSTFYRFADRIEPALRTSRVQFLVFHEIPPGGEKSFNHLIGILARTHRFVSYSDAVNQILTGQIHYPAIAISFDDGLLSCLRAAEILWESGISACFFLCPTGLDAASGWSPEFCTRLRIQPTRLLSWSHAEKIAGLGHEVGAHTMTHAQLATLQQFQLENEIRAGRAALSERLGSVNHFAWPFGRFQDFSPSGARSVFDCGFTSCASSVRGCHNGSGFGENKTLCLRRDHVDLRWPLSHVEYFLARNARHPVCREKSWPAGWRNMLEI